MVQRRMTLHAEIDEDLDAVVGSNLKHGRGDACGGADTISSCEASGHEE